jgi:hypothetical protein
MTLAGTLNFNPLTDTLKDKDGKVSETVTMIAQ